MYTTHLSQDSGRRGVRLKEGEELGRRAEPQGRQVDGALQAENPLHGASVTRPHCEPLGTLLLPHSSETVTMPQVKHRPDGEHTMTEFLLSVGASALIVKRSGSMKPIATSLSLFAPLIVLLQGEISFLILTAMMAVGFILTFVLPKDKSEPLKEDQELKLINDWNRNYRLPVNLNVDDSVKLLTPKN